MRRVARENTDGAAGAGRHDRGIRFDASVERIQRGRDRLGLAAGPQREIPERSGGHDRDVQRVGLAVDGMPQAPAKLNRGWRLRRCGPPNAPRVASVGHAAWRNGHETESLRRIDRRRVLNASGDEASPGDGCLVHNQRCRRRTHDDIDGDRRITGSWGQTLAAPTFGRSARPAVVQTSKITSRPAGGVSRTNVTEPSL